MALRIDQLVVAKNDGELIYQGKQVEKISHYLKARWCFCKFSLV